MGFPGGSDNKESACNAGDVGWIPGLGRSPGEWTGNSLQYSCLENPMDRGVWWASVHWIAKRHDWASNTHTELFIAIFIYIYVCMYACTCVLVYVCGCEHMCVYTKNKPLRKLERWSSSSVTLSWVPASYWQHFFPKLGKIKSSRLPSPAGDHSTASPPRKATGVK